MMRYPFLPSKDVALTSGQWVKILTAGYYGTATVRHTSGSYAARIAVVENPWVVTFDGVDDYGSIGANNEALTLFSGEVLAAFGTGAIFPFSTSDLLTLISDQANSSFKISYYQSNVQEGTLFSFCDSTGTADTYLQLRIDEFARVAAKCVVEGVTQWEVYSLEKLLDGEYYRIKLVHNGTEARIHVNGASDLQQNWITTTDKTAWIADISGDVDSFLVGAIDTGSGATDFFSGYLHAFDVHMGIGGVAQEAAIYRFLEGADAWSGSLVNGYVMAFSGTPTWADFYDGRLLDVDAEEEIGDNPPGQNVWAKAAGASVEVNVTTDSAKRLLVND